MHFIYILHVFIESDAKCQVGMQPGSHKVSHVASDFSRYERAEILIFNDTESINSRCQTELFGSHGEWMSKDESRHLIFRDLTQRLLQARNSVSHIFIFGFKQALSKGFLEIVMQY